MSATSPIIQARVAVCAICHKEKVANCHAICGDCHRAGRHFLEGTDRYAGYVEYEEFFRDKRV